MNITKLSDDIVKGGIKDIWPLEEKDFSPWVANNLQDIEEIIGKHIVSYELEKSCGRYESDIVATTEDGEIVIIENKLGTFDHDHFGKALIYMSYFHAKTIVWICDKYYEEHIKAINQLNDMSSDEYAFYALDLKLFKTDSNNIKYDYHVSAKPDFNIKCINSNIINSTIKQSNIEFYNKIVDILTSKYNIKFTPEPRGLGYGWTKIKTQCGNKVSLMMNISQRYKTACITIENADNDIILYSNIEKEVKAKYASYEFEQTTGVKNKNLIRMQSVNKFNWNESPIEQIDNIVNMFVNVYNIISTSNNL